MNKIALFLLVGLVSIINAQTASRLTQMGTYLGEFLIGSCNAFQENPGNPDKTTVCYKACLESQTQVLKAFTLSEYVGSVWNLGDFNNHMQVFYIKLMTQMDKCSYNNYLNALDNRLSDLTFLSGMVTKLGVETVQKYLMGQDTPTFKSVETIIEHFKTFDMEQVGMGAQLLFAKLVNYTSPNVKTKAKTY